MPTSDGDDLPALRGVGPAATPPCSTAGSATTCRRSHIVSDQAASLAAPASRSSRRTAGPCSATRGSDDDVARELADIQLVLADAGLHVAVVDIGTSCCARPASPGCPSS